MGTKAMVSTRWQISWLRLASGLLMLGAPALYVLGETEELGGGGVSGCGGHRCTEPVARWQATAAC